MSVSYGRRNFLQLSAAGLAAASALMEENPSRAASNDVLDAAQLPSEITDVHVYLKRWPFRRMIADSPDTLAELLRGRGVVQAWAGSFEGVFHKDIRAVNERLFASCRAVGDGLFIPFGSVNPQLPDWEEDLERCHSEFGMPGIRLHPTYHRYPLDAPEFERLLEMAAERNLLVQIVPWLEDERHHHALMPIPQVDLSPLPKLVSRFPQLRLVLSNGFRSLRGTALLELLQSDRVYCDFAMLDVIDGLAVLLERTSASRILFGSYSPMFYFDSALLKLKESVLSPEQVESITRQAASKLLPASRVNEG